MSTFSILVTTVWFVTTVVLIRPIPTVIAEVTHSVGLHTHPVVAHEHILGTKGLGLCEWEKKSWIYPSFKKKPGRKSVEHVDEAGSQPGRVQLLKSISSMAMCPGLVKVLEASNRMVKSWGLRPRVTSPWRHKSSWLPDSHHNVVVLGPSFNTTFSSATSVTVYTV